MMQYRHCSRGNQAAAHASDKTPELLQFRFRCVLCIVLLYTRLDWAGERYECKQHFLLEIIYHKSDTVSWLIKEVSLLFKPFDWRLLVEHTFSNGRVKGRSRLLMKLSGSSANVTRSPSALQLAGLSLYKLEKGSPGRLMAGCTWLPWDLCRNKDTWLATDR